MERLPFIDVQGLAGAWSLGTAQAGFNLVHRASLKGGFGDPAIDANRHFVGLGGENPDVETWAQDPGGSSSEWEPMQAAFICGTPPCSGFSLLNNTAAAARKAGKPPPASARGAGSIINECMRELVRYAARCSGTDGERGPEVVSFESVQLAYKNGRDLMRELRSILEAGTDQSYNLHHVLMSGASVGAAQMRHRYYWVAARVPFGVDPPEERTVATYYDAIGDLVGLEYESWKEQRLRRRPSPWLTEQGILRDDRRVDAHVVSDSGARRMQIFLDDLYPYWELGDNLEQPLRRYIAEHGKLPKGAERWWDWDHNKRRGFSGPRRIFPDKPGYVITGGGIWDFMHWEEPRFLTVRELSRLMGYPDAWDWSVAGTTSRASMWIGKCCPVNSGRWLSTWVRRALEREPGALGEPDGDREYVYNTTNVYKKWPVGYRKAA